MVVSDAAERIAPKLVRLYDRHQFYDFSGGEKVLARRELADAVADLLGEDLSLRESELVSDILVGLIRQAEEDLKKALSQRLSALEHAPLRVVLFLANEPISVAAPVLQNSPVLGDVDLLYLVTSHGAEYWQAIARRKKMGARLIDALAETLDMGTVQALAENHGIILTGRAMEIMGGLSEKSESLATSLLARTELPREIATKIYAHVGAVLRERIVSRYGLNPETLLHVDDTLGEFSGKNARSGWMPTALMISAAQERAQKGGLDLPFMMEGLRRGQISSFIAQISAYSGVHPQAIDAILHQPNGARLAGLCRSLDIGKSDFTAIFLLTQRMRSQDGIVTQKELARALLAFERSRDLDKNKYLEACRKA